MDRLRLPGSLVLLLITIVVLISFPTTGSTEKTLSCGKHSAELFDTTELSTVVMDTLSSEFDEALGLFAQGKCSDLKPDYCGLGACEKGWVCKPNVNQCLCSPPN